MRAAPGRSTVVAELDLAEVREAHAVVAAMHRLAVAEAVARLTGGRPRPRCATANDRFAAAVAAHDTDAALAADDDFHAVAVDVARQPGASPRCSTSSARSCAASSGCASPRSPRPSSVDLGTTG